MEFKCTPSEDLKEVLDFNDKAFYHLWWNSQGGMGSKGKLFRVLEDTNVCWLCPM